MAINLHNMPSGVNEPGLPLIGLLRSGGAPCRVLSHGEALALLDGHEPLPAVDVRRSGAGLVCPAAEQTSDLARTLHARRALEAALDHGTALLAALGLPRLVDDGFSMPDYPAMNAALDQAMALLDAIDPDQDAEEEDHEPWLGWPEGYQRGDSGFYEDRELDLADEEPSLGAPEQHEGGAKLFHGRWISTPADQRHWADGGSHDREAEITDEPHDGDSDAEPSIGWPEDYAAKLDAVLQADHDPEADDADLEDGDEDDDYRAPWIDGPPAELVGGGIHV